MKLGEKLYIALYSKGHSVIEIRWWLNAENIISRLPGFTPRQEAYKKPLDGYTFPI